MAIARKVGKGGNDLEPYNTSDGKYVADGLANSNGKKSESDRAAELLNINPQYFKKNNSVGELFDMNTGPLSQKVRDFVRNVHRKKADARYNELTTASILKHREDSRLALLADYPQIEEIKRINCRQSLPKQNQDGSERLFIDTMSRLDALSLYKAAIYYDGGAYARSQEKAAKYDTFDDNSPERLEFRKQIISDEIKGQETKLAENGFEIKRERKCFFVLGQPGSGKSTIATPFSKKFGAYIIDADNMKERIPEFQADPEMIDAVHFESKHCSEEMLREVSNSGSNVVIGKVGGYAPTIINKIKEMQDMGYTVNVAVMDVSLQTSLKRNIERKARSETTRIVKPAIAFDSDVKILDTYDLCCNIPGVNCILYSNEVEKGQKPKILRKDGDKADMLEI